MGGGALRGIVVPGMLLGGVIALAVCGALPTLSLFLPALLMLSLEQEPGRPMTRTLLLFGLVGAWDPLAAFWRAGGGHPMDWMQLLDLITLAHAWLAQCLGWLLAEGLTLLLVYVADRQAARVGGMAQSEIHALDAEWKAPADDG